MEDNTLYSNFMKMADAKNQSDFEALDQHAKNQSDFEALDQFVKEEIVQYEQKNPFYLSAEGSQHKYTKLNVLGSEFKNIYILCLANDYQNTESNFNRINLFLEADSDISELNKQSSLVSLVKCPFDVIHNNTIKSGLIVISKDILEMFNPECHELGNKELVFLMLNTKESNVKKWIEVYNENNTLDQFIEQKIFSSYYDLNDSQVKNHLVGLIDQVTDFKYWENERNCTLSIGTDFDERKFNLNFVTKWNLPIEEIEKELQNLIQNFSKNKAIAKVVNPSYPPEITNPHQNNDEKKEDPLKMNTYVDGAKGKKRSYYVVVTPEHLVISQSDIQELLTGSALNEKEKYYLICNLLISKKYCHYVLGNSKVLEANKEIFGKYKPIFRYLIGYAWVIMYLEESIKKTRTKETDRFVFDIETASKLPVFPFCQEDPHLNPYFTLFVPDKSINSSQNLHSVKQSYNYQNGIVDLTEFKRRLNIFITGKANVDLFDGANWSNMTITGGCMPAILPKANPLMALFNNVTDPLIPINETDLNRFYQEYYAKSDIDIACNHSNIFDFIENTKNLKNTIEKNLKTIDPDANVCLTPTKTLAIYVNADLLKEKCESGEVPFSFDYIIHNKNNPDVKIYFYELYLNQKCESNKRNKEALGHLINDPAYFEIVKYVDIDGIVIIINNTSFESEIIEYKTPESNNGVEIVCYIRSTPKKIKMVEHFDENEDVKQSDQDIFIKFSETMKFQITSKYMKHSFEIFRINSSEFFSSIARFHLPCVRAYYNGKTCFMLPSAITAYQTLTNIDFKYFVGKKDPVDIINKYRNRGFGTMMNSIEVKQVLAYILNMPHVKKMYQVTGSNDVKNIIGPLDVNHEFFKPRKNIPEDYPVDPDIKTNYLNPKLDYLKSKDIEQIYKKQYPKYSTEFVSKHTINAEGNIEPVKRWMIDASYDLLA
jgi:hypothetical protein